MARVKFRFVAHKGLFTWLCRLAQYGVPYTHCEVLTPEGKYLGALLMGGVQERPLDYDGGVFLKEAFVSIPCTAEQEARFFAFLRDQIGKPFDPVGILYFFGLFSRFNWRDPGAWWCTDLAMAALESAEIVPVVTDVPYTRVTPSNLYWLASILSGRDNV